MRQTGFKKVLVIANGLPPSRALLQNLLQKETQLVAVDGGLTTCLHYGLKPDLLIGDFDSVSQVERDQVSSIPHIHTPDQNKSDLEKALEYLFQHQAEEITVCGAIGKRLDHTLTNICLLCRYPGKVKFETDFERSFALSPSSVIACQPGQTLSLMPASTVTGVVTQGLQWELKGETLDKHFFSISNKSVVKSVSITFTSGDLIICLNSGL